jgi:hypothetical protein
MSVITCSRDDLKEVVRELLRELRSECEQTLFTPNEVANMATSEGFHKTGDTVRNWCSLSQIPFQQAAKGEPIYITADTVKALRANRWRALSKPDYNCMPPSRRARSTRSPSHAAA